LDYPPFPFLRQNLADGLLMISIFSTDRSRKDYQSPELISNRQSVLLSSQDRDPIIAPEFVLSSWIANTPAGFAWL